MPEGFLPGPLGLEELATMPRDPGLVGASRAQVVRHLAGHGQGETPLGVSLGLLHSVPQPVDNGQVRQAPRLLGDVTEPLRVPQRGGQMLLGLREAVVGSTTPSTCLRPGDQWQAAGVLLGQGQVVPRGPVQRVQRDRRARRDLLAGGVAGSPSHLRTGARPAGA